MRDACAGKRGVICGWERDHFNSVQQGRGGRGDGQRWNLPYGGERKTNGKNGREERRKEAQPLLSTHLMLPAGPRDADGTVLLIHSPSPTSYLIFCTQSIHVALLPLCLWRASICPVVLCHDLVKMEPLLSDHQVCCCTCLLLQRFCLRLKLCIA